MIYNILHAAKISLHGLKKLTPREYHNILRSVSKGLSDAAIAKRYKVTENAIRYIRIKFGADPLGAGEGKFVRRTPNHPIEETGKIFSERS